VLVVCAHPDDVDFGAAGTVAALTAAGSTVSYCLVTSGEAGSDHLPIDADELRALREKEQTEAASRVGVTDLTFLGFPDGQVEATIALREAITAVIRRTRPEVVISQSPDRNYDRIYASHPDHLAAGEATLCAVYPDSRNPFTFTELMDEGHEPWTVREVWMGAFSSPNRFVDITDTIEMKIAALRRHVSQLPNAEETMERVRQWTTATAKAAGLPDGSFAEGSMVIET
jgi:LmbE family N-acetylglucosaminyl deacetylase